ncbi:MAG: sugar transferase [Thermoanaerobaculia bacterium]
MSPNNYGPATARAVGVKRGIPRLVEVMLALIGLIAALPILAIAAIAVRVSSPGPIFFRQQRVGRGGGLFTLYKFRSMRESAKGAGITASGDRRITAVGQILRATKIDELPELWNIVLGDMSFVGPRPEVPKYVDLDDPLWRQVLEARPGVTDPVTLRLRNEEALLSRVEDPETFYTTSLQPLKLRGYIKYLQSRSPVQDVRVILITILASLFPKAVPAPTVREIFASIESSVLEDHHSEALRWDPIRWRVTQLAVDLSMLAIALAAAYVLRYDFSIPRQEVSNLAFQLPLVVALQYALLSAGGVSRVIWRYVGISDLALFGRALAWSALLLVALRLGLTPAHQEFRVPLSVIVLDGLLAFFAVTGIRLLRRTHYERSELKRKAAALDDTGPRRVRMRVVIVGAGRAGMLAVEEIANRGEIDVVGFIDDDVNKVGALVRGVRVIGTTEDLPRIMRERKIDQVLVTIAEGTAEVAERVRGLTDAPIHGVVPMPGLMRIARAAATEPGAVVLGDATPVAGIAPPMQIQARARGILSDAAEVGPPGADIVGGHG